MAEQSTLATSGIRTGTLGSPSSLAIAGPLAEGDLSETARTSASRMGFYFDRTSSAEKVGVVVMGVERLSIGVSLFTYNGNTIWHAGNDGASSGLDADLLDGKHAATLEAYSWFCS